MKAIVIGNDHYNTLGVVRSLGEEGISVYLILISDSKSFVAQSKYISKAYFVQQNVGELMKIIISLTQNANDNYFLIPTSDFAAKVLDDHFEQFATNVICPNALGKIGLFQNKQWMNEYAKKMGLLVPEQMVFSVNDSHDIIWNNFPAIIKPVVSIEGKKSDILVVNDFSELKETVKAFQRNGYKRILIEEYIYGIKEHMVEILGYSRKNYNVEIAGVVSKIREYPIKNGSTSFAELVKEHPGLNIENVKKFVNSLKYYGIFDIEFKYANEKLYFIEMNFRNGAPSYILTQKGLNLPVCWIRNQSVNNKLNSEDYFMCEQNDLLHVIKKNIGLGQWIKEFMHSKKIFFSYQDIKPVFKYYQLFFRNIIFRRR